MSYLGTEYGTRDQTLNFGDSQNPPCTTANCLVCKPQHLVPRARSRSPVSRPRSPHASIGLDLSYNMNSGPSISSTTNYTNVQPTLSQNSQWTSNNQTVENQEVGYSSSLTMASQLKTRRRLRAVVQRTPSPPVAIIDLTTDTPTPPPPPPIRSSIIRATPTTTIVRERHTGRPPYFFELDDHQDVIENSNFPLYHGSYTSFSNEENLGGLFHPVSPIIVNETSNSTYYDQPGYNIDISIPTKSKISVDIQKPSDPAPAINDSIDGETIVLSCPICFEELRPTRKPTSTKCGHVFCEECLDATLNAHKKCPKCNAPIKRKSCIRLFL